MTSQHEMILPFTTKKEILDWEKCYTDDLTGAQRLVEEYLIGLKDTVRERKTPEKTGGYLLYDEFYDLFNWKLKREPRSLEKHLKIEIEAITREAFSLKKDWEKLNKLTDIHDVGRSVASAILHLCDHQKKYPILDHHALRSVGICEKYVHGPEYPFWQEYVDFCREKAKCYDVSMRALDRALWKLRGRIITESD